MGLLDGRRYLVLDAWGVLWQPGRDIEELMTPYLQLHGCHLSTEAVFEVYRPVSLGIATSADMWAQFGLSGDHDASYLAGVSATSGLHGFLDAMRAAEVPLAVLSNDIAEHSRRLRRRFGVEPAIAHWVISGDVGLRKPDPQIFHTLAARTGWPLADCLFVDDNAVNLDTARSLGMATVLFGGTPPPAGSVAHPAAASFEELAGLL